MPASPALDLDRIVTEAARASGIDPNIIYALMSTESRGDKSALSPKGAMGLMQLMPKTALELGVKNPMDPEENIRGGSAYIASLLRQFGDLPQAFAAYNMGPGALSKHLKTHGRFNPQALPAETRGHVLASLLGYEQLKRAGKGAGYGVSVDTITPPAAIAGREAGFMNQVQGATPTNGAVPPLTPDGADITRDTRTNLEGRGQAFMRRTGERMGGLADRLAGVQVTRPMDPTVTTFKQGPLYNMPNALQTFINMMGQIGASRAATGERAMEAEKTTAQIAQAKTTTAGAQQEIDLRAKAAHDADVERRAKAAYINANRDLFNLKPGDDTLAAVVAMDARESALKMQASQAQIDASRQAILESQQHGQDRWNDDINNSLLRLPKLITDRNDYVLMRSAVAAITAKRDTIPSDKYAEMITTMGLNDPSKPMPTVDAYDQVIDDQDLSIQTEIDHLTSLGPSGNKAAERMRARYEKSVKAAGQRAETTTTDTEARLNKLIFGDKGPPVAPRTEDEIRATRGTAGSLWDAYKRAGPKLDAALDNPNDPFWGAPADPETHTPFRTLARHVDSFILGTLSKGVQVPQRFAESVSSSIASIIASTAFWTYRKALGLGAMNGNPQIENLRKTVAAAADTQGQRLTADQVDDIVAYQILAQYPKTQHYAVQSPLTERGKQSLPPERRNEPLMP